MDNKVLKWNFVFQYGYVLTNIFNSIILLPLYLKNIDATTLGIWLATGNILAWMTLADPGIGDVLQQKIAELKGKGLSAEIGTTIGSGFVASAFILLISIVIGFAFYFMIGTIINKDVHQYPNLSLALMITVVATGFSLVSFTLSGINQGIHNAAQVAISSLTANFIFLIINIVFLLLGYGVLSIALSNLIRVLYINVYNAATMRSQLKKEGLIVLFSKKHFKQFIKIFSFTSFSRIINGVSNSIDVILLARFIPAPMITLFEVNKRPVKITQSLIGRHSVALMPLVSHAKGRGDKEAVVNIINRHFKLFVYAALYASFLFCLLTNELITVWTGEGNYAGNTIMFLMVGNFFFSLLGYFMSNMGYALGDIKMNSLVNIIKGILIVVSVFLVASEFGIIGTLMATLGVVLVTDFFYFSYRLYTLGYLQRQLISKTMKVMITFIPISLFIGWGIKKCAKLMLAPNMIFSELILVATIFSAFYLILLFITDADFRTLFKRGKTKIFSRLSLKPI